MIESFVKKFDSKRPWLREQLLQKSDAKPSYDSMIRLLCTALSEQEDDGLSDHVLPDPKRITRVDYGDYQGTIVFVIAAGGYQPHNHWATWVWYGSCGGCDTLQAINDGVSYDYDKNQYTPNDKDVDAWLTVMLHLLQHMTEIVSF
jgi:hypothetical protein